MSGTQSAHFLLMILSISSTKRRHSDLDSDLNFLKLNWNPKFINSVDWPTISRDSKQIEKNFPMESLLVTGKQIWQHLGSTDYFSGCTRISRKSHCAQLQIRKTKIPGDFRLFSTEESLDTGLVWNCSKIKGNPPEGWIPSFFRFSSIESRLSLLKATLIFPYFCS